MSLRENSFSRGALGRAQGGHQGGRFSVRLPILLFVSLVLLALSRLGHESVREFRVEAEALVDTGATRLYLQSSLIKALGLRKESEVQSKTTNGVRRRAVYQPVRLDVMGRNGAFQVVEVDDDVPNLLGQIPLEYLDFVVDPRGQKLIPNPEHGDKQMSEEY